MTGYTVHTGSNDKFRNGWDNIFKSGKSKSSSSPKKNVTKKKGTESQSSKVAGQKKQGKTR